MSHLQRSHKEKESAKAKPQRPAEPAAKSAQTLQRLPGWVGRKTEKPAEAPKVQRQVAVSEPGDRFEREADRVAQRVKGGDKVPKDSVSRVSADGEGVGQRAAAEPTKKPAQREGKARDKKEAASKSTEEKLKEAPVQKQDSQAANERKTEDDQLRAAEKTLAGPVQKTAEPQDRNLIRPKEEPDRDAGTAAAVQRKEGGPAPMEEVAQRAIESKGAGKPLNPGTRDKLESGLGADLSDVRVHDDPSEQKAARDLDARAFTHGRDIWLASGESQSDTALMAHESAHVLQQTGMANRTLQRATKAVPSANQLTNGKGVIEGNKITIPLLQIPKIKKGTTPEKDFELPKPRERPTGAQTQAVVWRNAVEKRVATNLPSKLDKKKGIVPSKGNQPPSESADDPNRLFFYTISTEKGKKSLVAGNKDQLAKELAIPRWGPTGKSAPLDVDHVQEWQLGGPNDLTNMALLDASSNRSSGSKISYQIKKTIAEAVQPPSGKAKDPAWQAIPQDPDLVRQNYRIIYEKVAPSLDVAGDSTNRWEPADVEKVEPLDKLKLIPPGEVKSEWIGAPTRLLLYPLPTGGRPHEIKDWKADKTDGKVGPWLRGLQPSTMTYKVGEGGTLSGNLFPKKDKKTNLIETKPFTATLLELGGFPYTVYLESGSLLPSMKFMELRGLSPIEFTDVGIDESKGLVARGTLKPSLPFFKKDVVIDVLVEGDDVRLSKTFTKDDFSLPGPIKIPEASFTVFVGTEGLGASGLIAIEIERVGKGTIEGQVSTGGGLELAGKFEFDTKLFDEASVKVWYKKEQFGGEGKLTIGSGKVRGIDSANLTVTIAGDSIAAVGAVKPKIPGVEQADLSLNHSPEQGLVIAGHLELKKNIPGIAGGSIDVTVSKPPGVEDYKVKATGTATPKIPGVSAQITVTYDDGAFDIVGTAGYEKGMLKGAITIGATNRPVADDGTPTAAPPAPGADKITLYGGGTLSLKLAPWLQATAAVKLKPNGEIEVTGRIGLPSTLELFKEKKLDKNIFKVGIDIPIVGVAIAGQRIGIFANITGGLDLSAGIGPGELQDLHLEVTYNPAHEDQTHVAGAAKLHIPAQAGLRMFVRGSLGIGIPIVSASAGIEVGGGLGLAGALDAAVNVDWTPLKGLDIQASAEIYVQPKLKFDITGFVLVEADLWITTIELYSKRWQLASVEYGSDLRFGLKLPIHYREGAPFDLSFDNVEFITPNISAKDVISGLVKKIA